MWGDDFFCLFFEYATVAFLSANNVYFNFLLHAYLQDNLKRI